MRASTFCTQHSAPRRALGQRSSARSATGRAAPVPGHRSRLPLCVKALSNPVQGEQYDYIVVGGGATGCVMANRLSSARDKKVLVLEAGGPMSEMKEVRLPAGLTRCFHHPVLDWNIFSKFQKQLQEREIYLARGRALGGSSCTNATLYLRGSPADYNGWGLDGWSGNEVVPWFVSAENYSGGKSKYHGQSGVMQVEDPRYDNPLHEEFFRSAAALGWKANPDFNDWSRPQEGYGEFQVTQNKGERADMARQYLKPVTGRENLKIVTHARTTKVNIDTSGGASRAKGVDFALSKSDQFTAELAPGGEVLMCAGTLHTPQILMLSGVGPSSVLSDFNIPAAQRSEGVGSNLQDHPAAIYSSLIKPEFNKMTITDHIYSKTGKFKLSAILQYLLTKKGPFASTGCDHGAFVSTTGQGEPDLQMRFVPGYALEPDAANSYVRFAEIQAEGKAWPAGITIQLLAVRAKSKGSVGLHSLNPFERPAVDIAYLSDPEGRDLATLRQGVRLSRDLAAAPPLSRYVLQESFPGSHNSTDSQIDEFVRNTVHSGNALTGTCRMGNPDDKGAVVDHRDMRVFGVRGLRVVDASTLPTIPGGQAGAAAIMVAERAAAAILRYSGNVGSGGAPTPVPSMATA